MSSSLLRKKVEEESLDKLQLMQLVINFYARP
jgi:hypothetical protein